MHRYIFLSITIIILALAASVSGLVQTDIIYNMDDTYVNSSSPTTNFNDLGMITGKVGGVDTFQSFFKFSLSDPSGYYVTQAELNLYVSSATNTKIYILQNVSDTSWTESGITWNTKPAAGATLSQNEISVPGWTTWSLSDTFARLFSSGADYASYALTETGPANADINIEDSENSLSTGSVPYLNLSMMIPEVYLLSPGDSASTYDTTPDFQYNTTDVGNILNCSLVLDGAVNMSNSTAPPENSSSTFTPSALFPGDYTWTVRCYDSGRSVYQIEPATRDITILASVEWYNPSSLTDLALGNGVKGGADVSGTRQIYSNNTNNNAAVSCTSGDCSVVTTNWSTTSMTSGQILTAGFNCSADTAGSYSADFASVSDQDASADTLTVTCTIQAPDIRINSTNITFSDDTPTENQEIDIYAGIYNDGDYDATGITVRFYNGNYTIGTQIGSDHTIDLVAGAKTTVTQNWTTSIGTHDITIVVDPPIASNGSVDESDETNNYAHVILDVPMWTYFVGNVTGKLALQTEQNQTILSWNVSDTTESIIYVTDTDATPDFNSLIAFTRNMTGSYMSDDFTELDSAMGTTAYPDSLNLTYTSSGNPKSTQTFTVFGTALDNVPVINSTDYDVFKTGILWDSSDDEGNGQFDNTTKEDVVFVVQANQTQTGMYGTYDYEIRVPARLKNYGGPDTQTVTFYSEIK